MQGPALGRSVNGAGRSSLSSALNQVIAKGDDWTTINPLHIFRALLRQCTYLPDSAARHYFRTYIVMRFRKYSPRPPEPSVTLRLQQVQLRKELIKKARKGLVLLERANNGHCLHLEKVLAMTYGRQGKRRRELLQRLLQNSPPRRELLEKLVESMPALAAVSVFGDQAEALIKSQRKLEVHAPSAGVGRLRSFQKINKVKLNIPERNSWDRPTPRKRVQNMKAKWHAELLDKIKPPLPMEQWERLKGLATGTIWEGLVQRRTRAGTDENVSLPLGTRSPSDIALSSNRGPSRGSLTNPHQLTPRFMRRMWSLIYHQCPCMTWDVAREQWIVQWGGQEMKKDDVKCQSVNVDMSLFEEIDENNIDDGG